MRAEFWNLYVERYPEIGAVKPRSGWNYWMPLAGGRQLFSAYIVRKNCGVYVHPPWPGDRDAEAAFLLPLRQKLESDLDAVFDGAKDHFLVKKRKLGFSIKEDWPALVDWLEEQRRRYTAALEARLRGATDGE